MLRNTKTKDLYFVADGSGDALNFELSPTHSIAIQVPDPEGGVASLVRTISLSDRPEALAGTEVSFCTGVAVVTTTGTAAFWTPFGACILCTISVTG